MVMNDHQLMNHVLEKNAELALRTEDDARWMREMLTDYKVPFDDHTLGRRLALNGFIHDLLAKIKAPCGEWRLDVRDDGSCGVENDDLGIYVVIHDKRL
jgi:hypothetical protein